MVRAFCMFRWRLRFFHPRTSSNWPAFLFILFIYYNLGHAKKQRPRDEMQKSQRPHIKADHRWYDNENINTN